MIGGHPERWPPATTCGRRCHANASCSAPPAADNVRSSPPTGARAQSRGAGRGAGFAEALGIPGDTFVELLRATPAYSRAVDVKAERMLARDYTPESRISQHRKDLELMLAAARNAGRGLPLTRVHAALLDAAIAAGDGDSTTRRSWKRCAARRRYIDDMKRIDLGIIMNGAHTQLRGRLDADAPRVR
jgi:hypothetical protein